MRKVGTLPDEEQARRFADVAAAADLHVQVEPGEGGRYQVWAIEEDEKDRIREELDAFLADPGAERYREVTAVAEKKRRAAAEQRRQRETRQVDLRRRWEAPIWRRAPVTVVLMAVSVLVAFATLDPQQGGIFGGIGQRREPVAMWLYICPFETVGDRIRFSPLRLVLGEGQVWRLVTPIFLHFGLFHILFNMLFLLRFGTAVEYLRGHLRFLLLVLVIAVASNTAEYYFDLDQNGFSAQPSPLFGGMSGVCFGLFGFVWMRTRYVPRSGFALPSESVVWVMIFFVACVAGLVGRIANVAHTVGLLVGVLAGLQPVLVARLKERLAPADDA